MHFSHHAYMYILFPGQKIIGTLHTKVKDTMNPLVQLNVYVKVSYQNLAGKDKMKTTHKPAQPAIAAVPIMTLNISNPVSCYKVGSLIDMDFKILLRKITSPMRVEVSKWRHRRVVFACVAGERYNYATITFCWSRSMCS